MKYWILFLFFCDSTVLFAQSQQMKIVNDNSEQSLTVDGKNIMINGMNWDYIPIGKKAVDADFWKQPEDVIKSGLDREIAMLQIF